MLTPLFSNTMKYNFFETLRVDADVHSLASIINARVFKSWYLWTSNAIDIVFNQILDVRKYSLYEASRGVSPSASH